MWSVRASSAAPYQCRSGTTLGGWFEADDLAVKLVVTDDEVGLGDDERIFILQVDSAELNLLSGLDVDKRGYRIGVPAIHDHQLDDAAILRALRRRRASGEDAVRFRLGNVDGAALLGLDPSDAAVAVGFCGQVGVTEVLVLEVGAMLLGRGEFLVFLDNILVCGQGLSIAALFLPLEIINCYFVLPVG